MQTTQSRARRSNLQGISYTVEDLDRTRKPKEVDAASKGENAKAAQLLMEAYYEQESARSKPQVLSGYKAYKEGNGYYVPDLDKAGRPSISTTPPPDWPFSPHEWVISASNGSHGLLCRAAAYIVQERERLMRQHEQLFDYGVNALDPAQLERLEKSKRKAAQLARRNWRERLKQSAETENDMLSTGGHVANSLGQPVPLDPTTYGNSIIDDMMGEVFSDPHYEDMNTPVEVNP